MLSTKLYRFICLFSLVPLLVSADVKDRMKSELDTIHGIVESYYAPADLKLQDHGWLLADEIEKAKDRVDAIYEVNNRKFQYILRDLFNSFKDYHVQIRFNSTEFSKLPFSVKSANGHYFVYYVDYDLTSALTPGDEIISFDGKPIQTVINDLYELTPKANLLTDQAFAERSLTSRFADRGDVVPKGKVVLEIRQPGYTKTRKVTVNWSHYPERIQQRMIASNESDEDLTPEAKFKKLKQKFVRLSPDFQRHQRLNKVAEDDKGLLGSRKSYIPYLGKVIWESKDTSLFHAYTYSLPSGKKIGYIRIPTYSVESDEKCLKEFEDVIKLFNTTTDALVIDQINNPGGSVGYCFDLLSTLTSKDLLIPKDTRKITHREAHQAADFIDEIGPLLKYLENVLSAKEKAYFQGLQRYYEFILAEWNNGKSLTDPFPDFGMEYIKPNPKVKYVKPILVVINEMDISCGDLFPAVLQDNSRATLFGTTTAGAGGIVERSEFGNQSGIDLISYTSSLAERPDGTYIEGRGVSPDIEYRLTEDDFKGGFKNYRDAINNAVNNL